MALHFAEWAETVTAGERERVRRWQDRDREVASVYFAAVAADLEWHGLEPLAIGQDGDHVVAVLRAHFTVRATGKTIDALETHFFTFGPDGRITRYRPIIDTAAFIDAFTAD